MCPFVMGFQIPSMFPTKIGVIKGFQVCKCKNIYIYRRTPKSNIDAKKGLENVSPASNMASFWVSMLAFRKVRMLDMLPSLGETTFIISCSSSGWGGLRLSLQGSWMDRKYQGLWFELTPRVDETRVENFELFPNMYSSKVVFKGWPLAEWV